MGFSRGARRLCAVVVSQALALAVVVSGLVGAPGAGASGPALVRSPYLTDGSSTGMMVNFATDTASPAATVTYGPATGDCAAGTATAVGVGVTIGALHATQFKARIDGLSPGTRYCYRLVQAGTDLLGSAASPSFMTAPNAGTPFSFAVIGDFGSGGPDEANIFSQIAASGSQFVVTVGDNAYNTGTQTDYGDDAGGNVFTPDYWGKIGPSIPGFAVLGNHGFTANDAHLQNWPADAAVASSGGYFGQVSYCCLTQMQQSQTYAAAWYAFDWGGARFYMLEGAWADANGDYQSDYEAHWKGSVAGCPACGAQLQWLQNDLAAHADTPTKFAFFHYPLYSDSGSQPSDPYLDGAGRLEGVLAGAGVNVVFNGHAHIYERNKPMIPGSPMVSYVTGGGGAPLGTVNGCSAFDAYAIGGSSRTCNAPAPASNQSVFHFLKVSVGSGAVTVSPTDENGNVFDAKTYPIAGTPPPTTTTTKAPPTTTTTKAPPTTTTTRPSQPPGAVAGWELDGWGGLHAFGATNALPKVIGGPYWRGWDIARGVASANTGWGVVADGWGGLHPFRVGARSVPAIHAAAYWQGWDIVRGVAMLPDGSGGFVLDGWGGLHPFSTGTARPPTARISAYWSGRDIARGVTINAAGTGGYVVDGHGGLHPFAIGRNASPPQVGASSLWPTWDIARGVALLTDGQRGFTVDAWGGLHPFAPSAASLPARPPHTPYWRNWDIVRGVILH